MLQCSELIVNNNFQEIDLLTTSNGEPVDIRKTLTINADQFTNQFLVDLQVSQDAERIPERVVHAKGTGGEAYLEVTHDVSKYTSADVFNGIGKKTPAIVRFSTSIPSQGGTDLMREFKALSTKLYTREGNLDFLCLQTPVYFYKDPIHFTPLVHAFKRNPVTHLHDSTQVWDFVTLRPETLHTFLWLESDYGVPNGYRKMDAFPIHTYEVSNKTGGRHYVKFNFRTEQGLDNLTDAQITEIQGVDLDYYIRDLYNALARKDYPSWRLEMDVMNVEDVKKLNYDPFDVTRAWERGTYHTVPIGRFVVNKPLQNHFQQIEQSAFNPANLVPGIPGPIDNMFKGRRMFYRDTQNYRLGTNHNKIRVNFPKYMRTYVRDGVPPIRDNMKDNPNYYPNSYNGPAPFVDDRQPSEKLLVLQTNAADLAPAADFYRNVLVNEGQRQRLAESLVLSLVPVTPPVQKRGLTFMYLIDPDLGKRVELGLKVALLNAKANRSG